MKDYYKILGLNKEDSLQDIKQYRKLSMKYHPDQIRKLVRGKI